MKILLIILSIAVVIYLLLKLCKRIGLIDCDFDFDGFNDFDGSD